MENLTVDVSKQFDGFTFSLTPLTRQNIQKEFPSAKPIKSIFVAFDVKADLSQLFGKIEKYIYPALTGIDSKESLAKGENVKFVDSFTDRELHRFSIVPYN